MTGLRASHARTCAHAFAYFRAAEPVPSLLSSLSDLSGLIQGFAREKGLFRGLFRLCRFFLFFSPRRSQKFQERTARASSMSAPHTSYLIRHIKRARRAPPPLPRAPHQATQAHHPHRLSRPFLAPLALSSIKDFYYSTLHSCLCSPCPTRACLVAF